MAGASGRPCPYHDRVGLPRNMVSPATVPYGAPWPASPGATVSVGLGEAGAGPLAVAVGVGDDGATVGSDVGAGAAAGSAAPPAGSVTRRTLATTVIVAAATSPVTSSGAIHRLDDRVMPRASCS